MSEIDEQREELAARRYFILNAVRIGSIGALILGIAIARRIVDAPYPLGVALAVTGMLAFFFAPRMMARRWKTDAQDDAR